MHSNVVINFEAVVLLRLLPLGPDAYQSLRVVNVAQGAAIREGPGPIERKGSNGIRTQRKCGTVGILKGNSGDVRAMDVAAEENDVLDVTIEDGLKQLPPRGGKGGPCVVLHFLASTVEISFGTKTLALTMNLGTLPRSFCCAINHSQRRSI